MSRLDRLRSGVRQIRARFSDYRAAAERQAERRQQQAEQRVAAAAGLSGMPEPDGVPAEDLPPGARLAQAVAPAAQAPPAAGERLVGAPDSVAADRPPARERPACGRDDPAAAPAGTVAAQRSAGPPVSAEGAPPQTAADGGDAGAPVRPVPVRMPERPRPADAVPWGLRVAAEAGWRLLILAAVIWVLIQVVGAISLLVISFAAGLLITALLQPLTGRLKRLGLSRGAATAVTTVTGFGVMGLIGWFVVWQIMENVDRLVEQVTEGINNLRDWLLDSSFGVSEEDLNELADNLNQWISDHSAELTSAGLEGVNYLTRFLTGAGLVLFVVLFLLYDGRSIWYWFLKLVPAAARPALAGAGPRAWITLTGYVRGTVLVALIDAVGIGLGLWALSVPMAVPLAVIVFVASFVPIVGAIASGALAVVVAFVTQGPVTALLAVGVVLLVQQIEGNVLQPFILGRMVRVHPLAVVLAVTGGTLLAGIPGAVVAVPLVAVLNTVVTYLRAYHEQVVLRAGAQRSGATIAALAPTPPPSAGRDRDG
ncbi:AI-2E family transporter [Streptomyces aidingensis]|uniref:Predicted PurR-regulated permease PerM n=1 Tax=Streptomyces aidingensis TaxID=910347 RepID=A0A1I1EVG8_9ACTN|nr:AI-2E family transporter [Streptomyces aidingensis]SFB88930.1 Predicted PurR-regulated permease PerM [Streptomyces aidingensis]